jgi:hypothetical protein
MIVALNTIDGANPSWAYAPSLELARSRESFLLNMHQLAGNCRRAGRAPGAASPRVRLTRLRPIAPAGALRASTSASPNDDVVLASSRRSHQS